MVTLIEQQSNMYAVSKGSQLNISVPEVCRVLGMLLKMGIVHMPRYSMYWAKDFRLNAVAELLARDRFLADMRFMHFTDNNAIITNRDDPAYDRFAKIRPLTDMFKDNCRAMPSGQEQCVDEQVIKFKGRHSCKQYIPNKPTKRGFKVFSRNSPDGFMHDFKIYDGSKMIVKTSCGYQPGDVVIKLAETLPSNANHIMYYDNWFTFLELEEILKERGIYSCATIRRDRLRNCPTETEAVMRKLGRGSVSCHTDARSEISIFQWFDSKSVMLTSNFAGVNPQETVERWDRKKKERVLIPRPNAVGCYNQSMGGTDLFDMISSLYRLDHKSRKFYRRIFFWVLGSATVNAWVHYKRQFQCSGLDTKTMLDYLKFITEVSNVLCEGRLERHVMQVRGRPRLCEDESEVEQPSAKKRKVVMVSNAIRFDRVDHLPIMVEKSVRRRCRLCHAHSQIECEKCDIALCLKNNRNCFRNFHTE